MFLKIEGITSSHILLLDYSFLPKRMIFFLNFKFKRKCFFSVFACSLTLRRFSTNTSISHIDNIRYILFRYHVLNILDNILISLQWHFDIISIPFWNFSIWFWYHFDIGSITFRWSHFDIVSIWFWYHLILFQYDSDINSIR